MLLCKPDNS